MKKFKKITAALLSGIMAFGALTALPVCASAAETTQEAVQSDELYVSDNYRYRLLDDGTAEIESSWGSSTVQTIPSKLDGYTVTSIGKNAFSYSEYTTSITNITIPDSVTSIDASAFNNCSSLISIEVASNNTAYSSEDGILFNKDKTELVAYPSGKSGAYTIPDGVTSIGDEAFSQCMGLTSITIPDGVTSIGKFAFFDCGITSITIPGSVANIGYGAFYRCKSLADLTIPEGVTNIGEGAFKYCDSLTSITIPGSVTNIGNGAFEGCESLTGIEVASSNIVYSSEDGVLFNKSKTELITCPGGKSGAYTIPDSVTSIDDWAFDRCCNLTSVTIPNGVTSIGENAFILCEGLTSVIIPGSVTSIGDEAFYGCDNLTIYGKSGSYAETYASDNYITFASLGSSDLGDVNEDGAVDILDVTAIQKTIAQITELTETQKMAADVNGDGTINISDATMIQKYVAQIITSFAVS